MLSPQMPREHVRRLDREELLVVLEYNASNQFARTPRQIPFHMVEEQVEVVAYAGLLIEYKVDWDRYFFAINILREAEHYLKATSKMRIANTARGRSLHLPIVLPSVNGELERHRLEMLDDANKTA